MEKEWVITSQKTIDRVNSWILRITKAVKDARLRVRYMWWRRRGQRVIREEVAANQGWLISTIGGLNLRFHLIKKSIRSFWINSNVLRAIKIFLRKIVKDPCKTKRILDRILGKFQTVWKQQLRVLKRILNLQVQTN